MKLNFVTPCPMRDCLPYFVIHEERSFSLAQGGIENLRRRSVNASSSAEGSAALHQVASGEVEVGVLVDEAVSRVVVELVKGVGEESILITRGDTELSDPDRHVGLSVGLDKVVKEGLSTILTTGAVPVKVDKVHGAVGTTGRGESGEPVETVASVGAAGDGRSTNLDLANVLGEVLSVVGGSSGGVEVSLASIVALVEGEKSLNTVGDGGRSSLAPGGVVVGRTPEHGNVVDVGSQATVGEAPIVAPAERGGSGRDNGRDERSIVVTKTTLDTAAAGRTSRGGRGSGGSSCGSGGGSSSSGGDSNVSAGGAGLGGSSRSLNSGQSSGGSCVGGRGNDDGLGRGSGGGSGLDRRGLVRRVGSSSLDKVGARGGSGGLVASGDGHGLPDSGDIDLSGGVDDILLVQVSVVVGALDSVEEVSGGNGRDNVLGEHLEK
jgi:hypothetical protein